MSMLIIQVFLFIIINGHKCQIDLERNNLYYSNEILFFDSENKYYRAGHFVTTKNGELIIEYSEDATPGGGRLFYRLNPDGRGYYSGNNPIKQIEISKTVETKNENNQNIYAVVVMKQEIFLLI